LGEGRRAEKNFPLQKAYFQRVKSSVKKTTKNSELKVLFNGMKGLLLHPQQAISSVED
jgi:hypothetical protein